MPQCKMDNCREPALPSVTRPSRQSRRCAHSGSAPMTYQEEILAMLRAMKGKSRE